MPKSKISWAGAAGQEPEALNFLTWNCNKVSQGCKHCHAQTHARKYPQNSYGGEFIGAPHFRPQSLVELGKVHAGTVLFVNTHSDTFHADLSLDVLRKMFVHMNQRPDLIFLLLTKRPEVALQRALYLLWSDNIWLGTSIESMDVYEKRLLPLRLSPAKHKFVSFEPLLSPIQPECLLAETANWMIVGGESGEGRRPFLKQWAADLRDFASRIQVPFYFKQGSAQFPDQDRLLNGQEYLERPAAFQALRDQYQVNVQQNSLF